MSLRDNADEAAIPSVDHRAFAKPHLAREEASTAKRYILVVEDDALTLKSLVRGLEHSGYEALAAESGEQALQIIAARPPDLVMLDMSMPGISGIELAEYLRTHTSIPFIFLSSHNDADIVRQAIGSGAAAYLIKPINVEQLIPALEAALARAEEIRSLQHTASELSTALETGRETSMAIGIMMERYRIDRHKAFEMLRNHARSTRRKINDIAGELLDAVELLNAFQQEAKSKAGKNGKPGESRKEPARKLPTEIPA